MDITFFFKLIFFHIFYNLTTFHFAYMVDMLDQDYANLRLALFATIKAIEFTSISTNPLDLFA